MCFTALCPDFISLKMLVFYESMSDDETYVGEKLWNYRIKLVMNLEEFWVIFFNKIV